MCLTRLPRKKLPSDPPPLARGIKQITGLDGWDARCYTGGILIKGNEMTDTTKLENEARSGLSDSNVGLGWNPIATAPKDGCHIQLYRPEIQFVGFYARAGWIINAPGLPAMIPPPTQWRPCPPGKEL